MSQYATEPELMALLESSRLTTLLERYGCAVGLHEVRTRFLGNIASPAQDARASDAVRQLWGGEFPHEGNLQVLDELLSVLVDGLWNRIDAQHSGGKPFKLWVVERAHTRESLQQLARVRTQELDGFFKGLFGTEQQLELPPAASRALDVLAAIRDLLSGVMELLADTRQQAKAQDLKSAARSLRKLSEHMEREINKAFRACRRPGAPARRVASKPTLH